MYLTYDGPHKRAKLFLFFYFYFFFSFRFILLSVCSFTRILINNAQRERRLLINLCSHKTKRSAPEFQRDKGRTLIRGKNK